MESTRNVILKELIEMESSSEDEYGDQIIRMKFQESSSSSEDSSSSDEQEKHASVENFMNTIDMFSDSDFKKHFRLKRSTIESLINLYAQSRFPPKSKHGGNPKIGPRKEFHMFVWYLSNTVTFRQLGNLFGLAKSASWAVVQRVSDWFIENRHKYIKWPYGDDVKKNNRKFEEKRKIPDVLGAIDCTHIGIEAPKVDKVCYYNRKQSFTIILQAVVDADKKFIDVCCGEPGSLHDMRVLRRSPLFERANSNFAELFPNNTFILGDSAYSSLFWLVPPFKDMGNLTDQQKAFNFLHSSTRIVVENAFGLLKGRFRRLLNFMGQRDLHFIKKLVISACVLHNICISENDEFDEVEDEEYNIEQNNLNNLDIDVSTNRRDILFRNLIEKRII